MLIDLHKPKLLRKGIFLTWHVVFKKGREIYIFNIDLFGGYDFFSSLNMKKVEIIKHLMPVPYPRRSPADPSSNIRGGGGLYYNTGLDIMLTFSD